MWWQGLADISTPSTAGTSQHRLPCACDDSALAGDPPEYVPVVLRKRLMLPEPWAEAADVSVVVHNSTPFIALPEFHALFLQEGGPMPASLEAMRTHLLRMPGQGCMLVSTANHPQLMSALKASGIVNMRAAPTNLATVDTMLDCVMASCCRTCKDSQTYSRGNNTLSWTHTGNCSACTPQVKQAQLMIMQG